MGLSHPSIYDYWKNHNFDYIVLCQQNIVFAIGVKVLAMILVATGFVGMWMAVFADVGVAVLAILNSMRTLN